MRPGPAWLCASLFLALSLLVATPTHAGTEAAPEVSDSGTDSTHPIDGMDIVAVWIEPELTEVPDQGPALHIRLRVAADFEHIPAFFALQNRYRISFVPSEGLPSGAVEAYVNLSPSRSSTSAVVTTVPNGPESVSCRFQTATAAGASAAL